jgi:hypothetical protein
MKKLFILLLSVLTLSAVSCNGDKETKNESIKTEEIKFKKEGELTFKRNAEVLKKLDIEVAKNSYEHQTGLMYRSSMKENHGMIFVYKGERPRPDFYMKNTQFPLDLVYINADQKIVDFNENAKAYDETPLPSDKPAKYVLEINGGKVAEWDLKLGDQVEMELDEEK